MEKFWKAFDPSIVQISAGVNTIPPQGWTYVVRPHLLEWAHERGKGVGDCLYRRR